MNKFCLLLCIGVFLTGCATARPPSAKGKEGRLKDLVEQENVQWKWNSIEQVVVLQYARNKAKVLVGSNTVLVNESRVQLSSPVVVIDSQLFVPADFKAKVIDRLKEDVPRVPDIRIAKVSHILIDPGHGGKDPGALGKSGAQEKEIVLDISKRLKRALVKRGFKVSMTRDRDEFITLQRRTEIAGELKVDLFVSVHANSSPAKSAQGLEVFSLKSLTLSERDDEQRRSNEEMFFKNLHMHQQAPQVKNIVSDMMYDYKQFQSEPFSRQMANDVSRHAKVKNRGEKLAQFYVLRNTLVPAVLIETGFLSNPKEEKLLKSGWYRQKVAEAIARSIEDYAQGI